ncbi:uncharacterized protein V1510DRAFT_275298 [Dipodascopsis tothii]|uniref:uncharacterized protein n=1 Tax=Dipodascopsis tothii TaxID=44089 RepID=UPI0034CFAD70
MKIPTAVVVLALCALRVAGASSAAAVAATTTTTGDETGLPTYHISSATATSTSATSSSTSTTSTTSSASSATTTSSSGRRGGSSGSATVSITATNSYSDDDTALPTYRLTSSTVSYPAPTIPPTSNNPFLRENDAVNGTVFIAVGAIIGGIAAVVLAWRAFVAYMLRKSVHTAAYGSLEPKVHPSLSQPPSQFFGGGGAARRTPSSMFGLGGNASGNVYATGGAGSTLSLDQLTSNGRTASAARPAGPGHTYNTSMYYSPTADVMNSTAAANAPRSTTYLPAGFYGVQNAATSTAAISTSTGNLTARYSAAISGQHSASPSLSASRAALNVPPAPGSRAPSAYLQDLLDNGHGA